MATEQNNTKKSNKSAAEEIPNIHWADHAAEDLIARHGDKETLVCASGISPSGVVHIGNFREAITVEFVVRALRDRGRKVRFLYSWDDYDAFRKVPANLPNKELLEANLRKPISAVPDPTGEFPSYAARFEKLFENEISQLGIKPDYIYQNVPYRSGKYAQGIRDAMAAQPTIVKILNASRTEPLPAEWTCVSIFCTTCGKDATVLKKYEAPDVFQYFCKICKADRSIDITKEGGVKLLWRVDWPMRWAHEGVDFEPGGKDHSSQGGSYDTGCEISRQVWKREPPFYVQYDFVLAKGLGSKLSSSSGNLITLSEALAIYEPAVLRWIFASRKPNIDFSIAFDLDVMKAYDDFDRTERFAYGIEPGEEKKVRYEKRIYEFSLLEARQPGAYRGMPAQFGFRHLCNILQIHQGDQDKAKQYFAALIKTPEDEARFYLRAGRAWKWITEFAPEDFRFALRAPDATPPKTKYPDAVRDVLALIKQGALEKDAEDVVANKIYEIMKGHGIEPKAFFQDVYTVLINKTSGPKLASFLAAMGASKATTILEKSL